MARNCGRYIIQLNPLIFCDLLLTSVLVCGSIPIRMFEAGRWGTAISALGLSSVLTLALPLTFSLALFPLLSNCAVDASWGYPDGFFCSFSLRELEDLDLNKIRNPGRFPAKPRDNANPPTRAPTRSRFLLPKAHSPPALVLTRIATAVSNYGQGSRCGSIEFDCVYNTSFSHPPPKVTLIQNELETPSSEYLGLCRSLWYFNFTLRACALNVAIYIYPAHTSIFPRARTTWTFLSPSASASASTLQA